MQSRRDFLMKMALATSGLVIPMNIFASFKDKFGEILPLRRLGKTGEKVTMLGLGGFHIGEPEEKEAQKIIELAIEKGIRFFDNAYAYHMGESEKRYGKYLIPKYRDQIFLMTKSGATDYKTAKAQLEESLRRMNTDHVDLWQMHSLTNPTDVDNRINNGVLKAVEEALKEKKIRYAGFTGHNSPRAMLHILEQTKGSGLFSTTQMPVNVVDSFSNPSFIQHVMPELLKQEIGILGMKSLADGRFFTNKIRNSKQLWTTETPVIPNYLSVEEATKFAFSMPISSLMVGTENINYLEEKIDFVKSFNSLSEEQRGDLVAKVTDYPMLKEVEYYKKDRDYIL